MAASITAAVSLKAPLWSPAASASIPGTASPLNQAKMLTGGSRISGTGDIIASKICFARVSRKPVLLLAMAVAPEDLTKEVSQSILQAEEVCAGDNAGECAAAWDAVEELSAAASDKRQQAKAQKDPLEAFCKDNPETDECRVYED